MVNTKPNQPVPPIIPQVDLSEFESHTAQINQLIKEGFKKNQEQSHELELKFEEQKCKPLLPQKYLHTIELRPSKVVIALISLSVPLLGSVSYSIYQLATNSRLSDNDIKLRYIKAFGEITPENMLKLETIFEYEPDTQKQRSLRRMVEEHEQRVER